MESNDGWYMLSLVETQRERYYPVSDTSYTENRFRPLPTGVKPMTPYTPVEHLFSCDDKQFHHLNDNEAT